MLKKVLLFIVPPILAIVAFFLIVLFFNKTSGAGALQVTASPKSNVYLNGKLVGQTPLCKCDGNDMLSVGEYSIRVVSKEGDFPPYEEKITIGTSVLTAVDRIFGDGGLSEGKVITLTKLQNDKQIELSVVSFPTGVSVFADNVEIGKTPLLTGTLTASDHELRLVKAGYREKTIRIRTVLGYRVVIVATLGVMPNLQSLDASSSAALNASPSASLPMPTETTVVILQTPTGFLRVRADSSIASGEVARVNPGETYTLVDEVEGWYAISLKDGKTGWISSQYAKKQ